MKSEASILGLLGSVRQEIEDRKCGLIDDGDFVRGLLLLCDDIDIALEKAQTEQPSMTDSPEVEARVAPGAGGSIPSSVNHQPVDCSIPETPQKWMEALNDAIAFRELKAKHPIVIPCSGFAYVRLDNYSPRMKNEAEVELFVTHEMWKEGREVYHLKDQGKMVKVLALNMSSPKQEKQQPEDKCK